MLTKLGLDSAIAGITTKAVAMNYYMNGTKYTVAVDNDSSIFQKKVTFSGINGTITKAELIDANDNILETRNVNIILTSAKDLTVIFTFSATEI